MEWLLIVGLAAWVFSQHLRAERLERRVEELAQKWGRTPAAQPSEAPSAGIPQVDPVTVEPPPPARPVELAEPSPPRTEAPPRHTFDVSNWLAENGLAWLGGGALALGGLFLVVYATQRGFFTPAMRIGAAALAGSVMLAASEWIRRRPLEGRHPLAAAAAAGAGGATLYGAIWSAQQLYHLIPFELGAVLLVLCSLGLLAYALLHGEALAVLALFGAFAAPVLTGISDWRSPAPEAYLTVIIVTGFAFSALRRWPAAGYATIAGAFLWSSASIFETAPLKAALLLLALAGGACLATGWRVRTDGERPGSPFDRQPLVALGLASLLAAVVWFIAFAGQHAWTGMITVVLLTGMAAIALVRGLIPAYAFAAPIAAASVGLVAVAAERDALQSLLVSGPPLVLAPVLIAAIGWAASFRLAGRDRLVVLAASGLGAAFLSTISRFLMDDLQAQLPWAASALTALLMFAAAWPLATRSQDAETDRGLALWLAGGAQLLLLAVAGATSSAWEPVAHAAAAFVLVVAAVRLRWLGLAQAAVAASLLALAVMLRPSFIGEALDGGMPMLVLAGSSLGAVAITLAAGAYMRTPNRGTEAEALKTASLLIGLLGAFLVIQRLLADPSTAEAGPHLAASLRTVLLLAATLVLAVRARPDDGWLSRWRLRLLLAAGLAHGLLLQSLAFNPWWGLGEPPLGLPVLNTLLVAYLAPALLLGTLYRRKIDAHPAWTRAVAVGAFLFGLLWAILTIRHAFHPGPAMISGPMARNEASAYAALLLAAACALIYVRRRKSEHSDWLAIAAQPAAWSALALSALVFWLLVNPWWGPPALTLGFGGMILLFTLYGLVAGLAALVQRQALREEGPGWPRLAQAGLVTAVFTLFTLVTLLVRFTFHGAEMHAAYGGTSLETWAYSAVWALFGLGALVTGGLRHNYTLRWLGLGILLVTAAKVLLFDTSRLDGMIRAASYLALGVLLLAGALAARRLNARALLFATKN